MFWKQFGYFSVLCMFLYVLCFVQLNSIRSTEISFFFWWPCMRHKNRMTGNFKPTLPMETLKNEWVTGWTIEIISSCLCLVVRRLLCKIAAYKMTDQFCFWPKWPAYRYQTVKRKCIYRQSNGLIEEKQWESTANRKVLMRIAFIHMKNCWLVWFQCQPKTSIF